MTNRRAFHTLDGLRGVAAIFIVGRHVPALFGALQFPESFLAVDLFFVLSGYVLAYSYDAKLRAENYVKTFMSLRFIRLYPLYFIGLAIGLSHIVSLATHKDPQWTLPHVLFAGISGLFLFPALGPDNALVYPCNGPTWTLAIELVANAVFARFHKQLTTPVLLILAGVSAAAMIVAVAVNGSLDARYVRIFVGMARVGFSFPIGVLIFRGGVRHAVRPGQAALALAALAVVLAIAPAQAARPAYELIAALVVFPMLVWWASGVEPGNRAATRAMTTLGLASYAVYVLHEPIGFLVQSASARVLHLDLARAAPWSGAAYVVALIAACLALDRYYDQPARRWLRRKLEEVSASAHQ